MTGASRSASDLPQEVDWPTLDAAWARIGEHDVFESVWMNDRITNAAVERGGRSRVAHRDGRVGPSRPGKWLGHGVLSNTFRHPVVLAKQATLLDHVTGGRFIVGLGPDGMWVSTSRSGSSAGHAGALRPLRSAVHVLRSLFSDDAPASRA